MVVIVIVVVVVVVAVVVVKMLVWDAAPVNIVVVIEVLAIDVRVDGRTRTLADVVLAAAVITLELVVSISYFVFVRSDVVVDALIDVLDSVIMGFVSEIGVEVLIDANVNVFASLMPALECAVPKP